jgi:hypothetical protein
METIITIILRVKSLHLEMHEQLLQKCQKHWNPKGISKKMTCML